MSAPRNTRPSRIVSPLGRPTYILLVEDNPDHVRLVEEALSDPSGAFVVRTASSLHDALRLVQGETPDLILLDLSLPDGHGLDTLMRWQGEGLPVPIIILTSTDDLFVARIAIQQGAQDYLVKDTLTPELLIRSIHYAVERHKVEQALKVQKQNFHSLVEQSEDGMIIVDAGGGVRYLNPAAEGFLGLSANAVIGHSLGPRIGTSSPSVIEIIRKNGKPGLGEVRILPTEWQGEKASLVLLRDVTDQKAAEKLRDEFVQTVSHEFRSPLAVIRESVSQLLDGLEGPVSPGQRRLLSLCLRNADFLRRLADQLLDLARYESGKIRLKKSRFALDGLVGTVVESFRPRAEKREIALSWVCPKGLEVRADRDKIQQVLMNLLDNALKYTPSGYVRVEVMPNGESVICTVIDSGRGIRSSDLPRVFDKFVQFGRLGPSAEKGTGLGLAIAKHIITLHRGRIWVESRPGEGSRFSFSIPIGSERKQRRSHA